MTARPVAALAALAAFAALACDRPRDAPNSASAQPASDPDRAAPSTPLVLAPHEGIRWTQGPSGIIDASPVVRDAIAAEQANGRTLLVYVGATWCEPCQRFHHAVEEGALDDAFPHLSILAFDSDRDAEALATAGYASRLIPLFAIPRSDGHASGKQIEGGVKGDGAVGEITPRLRALLDNGP
jgi:thiol-disulfide isomerase/thioredoxin